MVADWRIRHEQQPHHQSQSSLKVILPHNVSALLEEVSLTMMQSCKADGL